MRPSPRHRSSGMETTATTAALPRSSRPTRRKRPAPTASLLLLGAGGRAWRSPELSIRPPCLHKSFIPLHAITTITISNRITGARSSKVPSSWTCMTRYSMEIPDLAAAFHSAVTLNVFFFFSGIFKFKQANIPVSYTVTHVPPQGLTTPLCSGQHLPPTCSSQQVPTCNVVISAGQHYHPVR